jgi:signal peptidase II
VWVLPLVAVIIGADFVTKQVAVRRFGSRRRGVLRMVANQRPLLGWGPSLRTLVMLWVAAVTCAVAALMCTPALRDNALITAGVAAAFAGASGNLVDRLFRGGVVDFIAIGRWPVFNLADVAIVGGAALVGVSL